MRFYGTELEKASRGNLLHESMSKGDMNAVMYGILKVVEYDVQIITYSQKFHNFYLLRQLCEMPKFCLSWSKIQMWYLLRFSRLHPYAPLL